MCVLYIYIYTCIYIYIYIYTYLCLALAALQAILEHRRKRQTARWAPRIRPRTPRESTAVVSETSIGDR